MDELMEHERRKELKLFLYRTDKPGKEQVVEPDEGDSQQGDGCGPEPCPSVTEPEDVEKLADAVTGQE